MTTRPIEAFQSGPDPLASSGTRSSGSLRYWLVSTRWLKVQGGSERKAMLAGFLDDRVAPIVIRLGVGQPDPGC